MFSSTPLDCTACRESTGNCEFLKDKPNFDFNPISNTTDDPKHGLWCVKKYCTMTAVHDVTLYFPYILLIIPLVMVAIEKGFTGFVYLVPSIVQINSNDEYSKILNTVRRSLLRLSF